MLIAFYSLLQNYSLENRTLSDQKLLLDICYLTTLPHNSLFPYILFKIEFGKLPLLGKSLADDIDSIDGLGSIEFDFRTFDLLSRDLLTLFFAQPGRPFPPKFGSVQFGAHSSS